MARDELSDNELDAFDSRNEQVLLDQAGPYLAGQSSQDEDSEEEVLGLQNQASSDEEESENESEIGSGIESEEEEEQGERWGLKKNYYGGDDVSDDEAGAEMAEEALRQQKKHLQELAIDDFVDEATMEDWQKTAGQFDVHDAGTGVVVAEEDVDFELLDEEERLKHLNGSFPEFVPLLKEFDTLSAQLEELKQGKSELLHAKFVALSAYLSSISSYFSIFVEQLKLKQKFSMKENPVMEAILSTREVWRQANELSENVKQPAKSEAMEDVSELSSEDVSEVSDDGRIQTDSEEEMEDVSSEEEPTNTGIDIDISAKRTIRTPKTLYAGDYTETATPDSIDKEEKERRKKSLRFYTSKIDQAAQKNARQEKFDGDADLPYRERLFERQQRLVEEARKKGLGQDKDLLGADLDDTNYGSADEKVAHEINENASEYYDQIRQAKKDTKQARRTAHEQAKKAAKEGRLGELAENADEHGKRALNFQIMKNKGLTPNRRNDNRNARVKKRKRYDQAQKKLRSVRQVYEEPKGPYQGEQTGIKKNLSRSVRLQ